MVHVLTQHDVLSFGQIFKLHAVNPHVLIPFSLFSSCEKAIHQQNSVRLQLLMHYRVFRGGGKIARFLCKIYDETCSRKAKWSVGFQVTLIGLRTVTPRLYVTSTRQRYTLGTTRFTSLHDWTLNNEPMLVVPTDARSSSTRFVVVWLEFRSVNLLL